MAKGLLEKTRSINKILKMGPDKPVDYMETASVLAQSLQCNVYIVGYSKQLIGYSFLHQTGCTDIEQIISYSEDYPDTFNARFAEISETVVRESFEKSECIMGVPGIKCSRPMEAAVIVPIYTGKYRIGTLILTKAEESFTEEDIILAEYAGTIVTNQIMRMRAEKIEEEVRKKETVQIAVSTLSYSEWVAIEQYVPQLQGDEGVLVASHIAEKAGITRSVIVSGVRKLESAGVIESRSLGAKGTYIKVLNHYLFDELEKHSAMRLKPQKVATKR